MALFSGPSFLDTDFSSQQDGAASPHLLELRPKDYTRQGTNSPDRARASASFWRPIHVDGRSDDYKQFYGYLEVENEKASEMISALKKELRIEKKETKRLKHWINKYKESNEEYKYFYKKLDDKYKKTWTKMAAFRTESGKVKEENEKLKRLINKVKGDVLESMNQFD